MTRFSSTSSLLNTFETGDRRRSDTSGKCRNWPPACPMTDSVKAWRDIEDAAQTILLTAVPDPRRPQTEPSLCVSVSRVREVAHNAASDQGGAG